jgi:uncharacterized protein (TIGR02466 family)
MSEIIPLFSTPVYYSKINNLDVREIESQIHTTSFKEAYEKLWLSSEEYIIDKLPKLKQNIINHLNVYLFDKLCFEPFNYYFSDSWFVKITPNGKSNSHFHSNSLYSGVVYFDFYDNAGEITFMSPESNYVKNTVTYLINNKKNTIFNSNSWSHKPVFGDILIFPSYVFHQVIENNSAKDRFSFAFNILPDNYIYNSKVGGIRITKR